MLAASLVALLAGLAIWAVASVRSGAGDLERRQDALDNYTDSVRAVLETMRPAVGAMIAVAATPEDADLGKLPKDASSWLDTLGKAQVEASQLQPPASVGSANRIFQQSLELYLTAARTYRLVPQVEGAARAQVLQRASEQRDQAANIFQTGIDILDDGRAEADMDSANLVPPSIAPPGAGAQTPPAQGGGGGGGDGGAGGG